MPSKPPTSPLSPSKATLPKANPEAYKTYIYTPTEKQIFTPSLYKDLLLPHWRFATPVLARTSSDTLYEFFERFCEAEDFVGADNARKFLQMGMTRAGRYANWRGGRKYDVGDRGEKVLRKRRGQKGTMGPKNEGRKKREVEQEESKDGDEEVDEDDWEGRKEKREASQIFRNKWQKAKEDETYIDLKENFLEKQKEWKKRRKIEGEG